MDVQASTFTPENGRLSPDELRTMDAWWRAANYLSVGQIYLLDNPLLREPLTLEHDRAGGADGLAGGLWSRALFRRGQRSRTNHRNLHVRGYKEEGTTTTPFDMVVLNDLDRFHLATDVIDRVPQLGHLAAYARQALRDRLVDHRRYIERYGEDMPEIRDWRWPG